MTETSLCFSWLLDYAFAHRGLHDELEGVPENSLSSFRRAVAAGYAIELDVQLLADGRIVVFHDATLLRLCGKDVTIATLNTATLQQYYLNGTAETIPLLAEVLGVVDGQVPLLIELKGSGWPGPLARAVLSELASYSGQVAIQSFNPLAVWWFSQHAPAVLRGQLAGSHQTLGVSRLLGRVLLAGIGKPHFLAYEGAALPAAIITRHRAAGRLVIAWTVRSVVEAARLCPTYCDGIVFEHFCPLII